MGLGLNSSPGKKLLFFSRSQPTKKIGGNGDKKLKEEYCFIIDIGVVVLIRSIENIDFILLNEKCMGAVLFTAFYISHS